MKITTAWKNTPDGPDLISAYTEIQFDDWGQVPEWHAQAIEDHDRSDGIAPIRELVIEIPDSAVSGLFATPTVKGKVS